MGKFFKQAAQNHVPDDVLSEYIAQKYIYSQACKKRVELNKLKNSPIPMEQLKYFKGIEAHKEACRVFHLAKEKYRLALANVRMKERHLEPNTITIAQMLGLDVRADMRSLIEEGRRRAREREIAASMTPQEMEEIIKGASKVREKYAAREAFLENSSGDELDDAIDAAFAPQGATSDPERESRKAAESELDEKGEKDGTTQG